MHNLSCSMAELARDILCHSIVAVLRCLTAGVTAPLHTHTRCPLPPPCRVITVHNHPENLKLPATTRHLKYQLADIESADISPLLGPAFDFIEQAQARKEGGQHAGAALVASCCCGACCSSCAESTMPHARPVAVAVQLLVLVLCALLVHLAVCMPALTAAINQAPPGMVAPAPGAAWPPALTPTPTPAAAVLVHCGAGVSRSATIVMAYLMRAQRISAAKARQQVTALRSVVCINDGFWRTLCALEAPLDLAERCGVSRPLPAVS